MFYWCFCINHHQLTLSRLSNRASCNRSLPNNFLRLLILITIFFINHYLTKTKVKEEMFLSLFLLPIGVKDLTELKSISYSSLFLSGFCVLAPILALFWSEAARRSELRQTQLLRSVHFNLSRVSTISFFWTNSDFFTKCRWRKKCLMVIVTQVCYLKLSWGSSPLTVHGINCSVQVENSCKNLSFFFFTTFSLSLPKI